MSRQTAASLPLRRHTLLVGFGTLSLLHCGTWLSSPAQAQDSVFDFDGLTADMRALAEVAAGRQRPIGFSTDDFLYFDRDAPKVPPHAALPGVAGFRINAPLNRADTFDEVVAFLGASCFRALGRGNAYGLSARGLAIDTGLGRAREFPRFTRFWIKTPGPHAREITLYAALESESCTGADRFVVRPGAETVMEVTARLFFRREVEQVGIAPLSSMFLFSEKNRAAFDDFRPNVHNSDGLAIRRRDGEMLWRRLNNPPRLAESWFVEESPAAVGLMQRDRAFESYQDASAHYERRPSALGEPLGDWGPGAVRLVEIPTDLEVNDNMVAFWVPARAPEPGVMQEYAYRLLWGALAPDPEADLAPVVTVAGGEARVVTLSKIEASGHWRLVLDILPEPGATVEMGAPVAGYGRRLSETWLHQWVPA